jgi:hypothetical protein
MMANRQLPHIIRTWLLSLPPWMRRLETHHITVAGHTSERPSGSTGICLSDKFKSVDASRRRVGACNSFLTSRASLLI